MLENEDKTELIEAFYKDLEFGTGGLRGIMGVGSNRMNIYTVGAATPVSYTHLFGALLIVMLSSFEPGKILIFP